MLLMDCYMLSLYYMYKYMYICMSNINAADIFVMYAYNLVTRYTCLMVDLPRKHLYECYYGILFTHTDLHKYIYNHS